MEGMKTAMKAKDTVTLNTLRALKTALTNTAIAKGGLGLTKTITLKNSCVHERCNYNADSPIRRIEQNIYCLLYTSRCV